MEVPLYFLSVLMHFATDITAIFLDQTDLVRLGFFHLELGEKKNILFALGMGPNFGPKFR